MPKIKLEFSVPEQPDRNVVTVTIEGPDPRQVHRSAMGTIDFYTGHLTSAILRIPGETGAGS